MGDSGGVLSPYPNQKLTYHNNFISHLLLVFCFYRCAGISILMNVATADRPSTCRLILGDETVGVFKRTMTRTDVTRLPLPDLTV
jgi:hypothetical protein